jgi:hypothetical protein
MDTDSYFNSTGSGARLPLQTIDQMNNCTQAPIVPEDIGVNECKLSKFSFRVLSSYSLTWPIRSGC